MILAEALARRAELSDRLSQLGRRALSSVHYQEGETPAEDPTELVTESDRVAEELEWLIRRVNATNLATEFEPGMSVTDALARRDVLRKRHQLRAQLADAGTRTMPRGMRSEIRMLTAVDVRATRSEADGLARELRELDTRIQQVNWTTELLE
jgi:hypothetical protein